MSILRNKKILFVLFLFGAFFLAIIIWYSPIIFKGYPTQVIHRDLILAKNYHETGVLALENNHNVVISSNLISQDGTRMVPSQYLRSIILAKIFDFTGVPSYNNAVLMSTILFSLVLILFTILVWRLLGFKMALIFYLIYLFSPISWDLTYNVGMYEWCLIFAALFFIFYFSGVKKEKSKFGFLFFILSGIFLALSGLSKEITLIFAFILFFFLLFKGFKKQILYIFIPFAVLLIIFWLPSMLSGKNTYFPQITGKITQEAVFSEYLHIFPDPYTYYFERDHFLQYFKDQNLGLTEDLETKKILTNFGFDKFSIIDRFRVGIYVLSQHVMRFFSLEEIGGPIIFLLLVLGIVYLKKKDRFLYRLSLWWILGSIFIFCFVIMAGRNHLMDFIWVLILMIACGVVYLLNIIGDHFKFSQKSRKIIETLIVFLLLYHLFLVNHVVLGKRYDKDFIPRSFVYAGEINKLNIKDEDVIAVPGDFPEQTTTLNYLTNKSFVIFKPETIETLYKENKLKKAFEAFNVKYILGYSEKISKTSVEQARITNIASNSLNLNIEQVSKNKSFLMNLFR